MHLEPGILRDATDFLRRLRRFLTEADSLDAARARIERQFEWRAQTFASLLERAVFAHPGGPYARLFAWAQITFADVAAWLHSAGLIQTLEKLHDAGVYLTLDEFKGRRPIERAGLEISARAEDFNNPLTSGGYEARTNGSTGRARRVPISLDLLEHEAAHHQIFMSAAGLDTRPVALWHLAPPGAVGIKTALIQARLARPVERWFSPGRPSDAGLGSAAFVRATALVADMCGTKIPIPEFTPPDQVARVAGWLAAQCAGGTPGVLVTTPSSAVRTCIAALDAGLRITGTCFMVAGEPCTPAKASMLARAGCRVIPYYGMVEAGFLGFACLSAGHPDEVHLLGDKVATTTRPRDMRGRDVVIPALYHTTLLAACPKIMINVESGDFAAVERRTCGCGAPAGLLDHAHTIRSYEKLTSEGMQFLGIDLLHLVENVLPERFGGYPTDYQLVEAERHGRSTISLVVRHPVAEREREPMVQVVLDVLGRRGGGQRLMAGVWERAGTLDVVHGEPHVTAGGKIPAIRTLAGC